MREVSVIVSKIDKVVSTKCPAKLIGHPDWVEL